MKRTLRGVWSPQRRNRRDVDIYLPESYWSGTRRYPVVYMQDGQNLSDPSIAFGGRTWDLASTIERLAARGLELIVVGVHHGGEARLAEYSPFPDRRHGGGQGDAYLEFLVETLKPRIDRMYRTRTARDETAIVGSSMGGLISLYAFFKHPGVFGRAAAMSPSIWFGQGRLLEYIESARAPRGRLYVDVGVHEGAGTVRDARRLARLLVRKGYRKDRRTKPRGGSDVRRRGAGTLRYVEDPIGRHEEPAWAGRLESALDFLLD